MNPKRMQRAIQKQLQKPGAGTKSQQALQLQHEAAKTARTAKARADKQAVQARRFALRTQKRRQKHRGR